MGLKPDAVMGVSSGETNAIFATGAWHDMDAMFAEIESSGMYTREIAGEYRAAQRAWPDREIDRETAAQSQAKKRVENLSEEDVEKALIKELEDTGY